MAFAGIMVECSLVGNAEDGIQVPAYRNKELSSENKTSAGSATTLAVPTTKGDGPWVLRITAAADCFIAVGASPDSSTDPRRFLPASQTVDIIAYPGEKVMYTAA